MCDILFQRFKIMPRLKHEFRFLTGKQANIFEQLPTSVIDTTCKISIVILLTDSKTYYSGN